VRRSILLVLLGCFALGAMTSILSFTPQVSLAERVAALPYLPVQIPPGISPGELLSTLDQLQYHLTSDSMGPQGLKTGIVQATSPDRRTSVFAFLSADGSIDHVRFRLSATDAYATQMMSQVDAAYGASGWSSDASATAQVTYTKHGLQVIVYRLFECDPDLPDEPFYWVMDVRSTSAGNPARHWTWWRRQRG
jgi:hypothetical protein